MPREVDWDGMVNARDLGGLATSTGGTTRYGRFYRSAAPDVVTARGWANLVAAGVQTLVDLRNAVEVTHLVLPAEVARHLLPVEDPDDGMFMNEWGDRLGSPLSMRASLNHWPEKFRAVFAAMADAPPGGIVFHCAAGRDRTGLVSALLLRLADVPIPVVLDDYALGIRGWRDWDLARPTPHSTTTVDETAFQTRLDQTVERMSTVLHDLDVADYLTRAGVTRGQLANLVDRLTAA